MLHFTLPDIYLGNAQELPFNGDFYMLGYRGMANLTATGTLDFYVSKPHFMDADAALIGNITGISVGVKATHDTFLNVEPLSGVTMQAAKRLQLSVRITPMNVSTPLGYQYWGAGLPNQVTGQYIPVYWAEEYGEINDDSAQDFVRLIYGGRMLSMGLYIAGEVAACALVIGAVIMFWVASTKDVAPSGTQRL